MPETQRIDPLPRATPAAFSVLGDPHRELPPDLLQEACTRLGIMALVGAALWILNVVTGHFVMRAMTPGNPHWRDMTWADAISAGAVVISLALYADTRRRDRDPRLVLDMGLAYMMFTGFALGLMMHMEPPPANWAFVPMLTWNGMITLMLAAIVPNTLWKFLIAAFVTVSMNPLAMLAAKFRGLWSGSMSDIVLMHYPDYLLAGMAAVISHVVTRLGQQVTKARELGSYHLGDLLGRGGMGEVYRATHRMLARPAAIKLIRPEMLGTADRHSAEIAVKRFRREAKTAASLRSPHTVELYDFGVTQDETLYFVMELLDGLTLESLVRQFGPVPASRVIHILRQVCDSLEEAHCQGLVHRDIKPANIHVGRLGLQYDFVKVLDFGLVKSVAATPGMGGESLATAAGLTPGTPAYMAPEMALGDAVDGRADLYALGCVAYYLLTGTLVFESDSALRTIAKHIREEPVPPSVRAGPGIVPLELDALVLACLAKRPEERPADAAQIARALGEIRVAPWTEKQALAWWEAHVPAISS